MICCICLEESDYLNKCNCSCGCNITYHKKCIYPWILKHKNLFKNGSSLLFESASHKDSKIRNWSLKHIDKVGMDLPFALKLFEVSIPECVNYSKKWFDSSSGTDEFVNLL